MSVQHDGRQVFHFTVVSIFRRLGGNVGLLGKTTVTPSKGVTLTLVYILWNRYVCKAFEVITVSRVTVELADGGGDGVQVYAVFIELDREAAVIGPRNPP